MDNNQKLNNKINLTELSQNDYYIEHLDARSLYLDITANQFTTKIFKKISAYDRAIVFINGLEVDWFTLKSNIEKITKEILAEDKKNNELFFKLYEDWQKKLDKMFKYFYQLFKEDISHYSDQELKDKIMETFNLYTNIVHFVALIDAYMFFADQDFYKLIEKFSLDNNTKENASYLFSILSAPIVPSFQSVVENDIIDIAHKKQNGINVDKFINDHLSKYSYINSGYNSYREYTEENVRNEINKIIKSKNFFKLAPHEINIKEKEKILHKYDFPKDIIRYIKLTELFSAWQDERKELTLTHICLENKFVEEIERRKGIDKTLLLACSYKDLYELLESGKVPAHVKKRGKEPTLAIYEKGEIVFEVSGLEALDFFKKANKEHDKDVKEISGFTASVGKVRGQAKIINTFKDTEKLQEGDILVIGMTRIEHLMAMKKAAAIVTDDGGITCHAAIISRELRKPCIIGTKIATKVLRDGDLVEVDADQGIIKILK